MAMRSLRYEQARPKTHSVLPMSDIVLDDLSSSDQFVRNVGLCRPFLCRNAPVQFEYKAVILAALQSNTSPVDISCCNEGESFCGNPIYREKVDMKLSDFMAAWVACTNEQPHWALELDLQLYLSQCCFACPKEPTACDIDPSSISVPLPYILCDQRLSSNQSNLWMNIQCARSTLHYDASHNLLLLLAGRKEVTLLSPSCTSCLKPVPASDANPNHSALFFEEVEGVVNDCTSGAAPVQRLVQKAVMHAGDALFIPEGWWHQVQSDQCSMAVNFWFSASSETHCAAGEDDQAQPNAVRAASTIEAGDGADMRPYKLRKLVHEMMRDELAGLSAAPRVPDGFVGVFSYGTTLTFEAFECALLSLVSCSTDRSGTDSVDKHVVASGERKERANERKRTAETVTSPDQSTPLPAPEQCWLAFAAASVRDQRRLWLPFANEHPAEWTQALLSLPPKAAARLLDYWDTLVPTDFAHAATDATGAVLRGAYDSAAAAEHAAAPSESTDPVSGLDEFFRGIFEPCGERVPEVRRRLIEQKNVHNQEVARRLLSSILGLPV